MNAEKVYIEEPWPTGICFFCRREKPIRGAARTTPDGPDRVACADCLRRAGVEE